MKSLTYIFIFFLLAVNAGSVSGQNKRSAKAYTTYDAGEYYAAIDQFKEAYQKTSDKKEKLHMAFHIAECYRKTDNAPQAALWYGKVIAKDYENPLSILYYADALRMNQNYEEAKAQYQRYKELVPDDPRGSDGILSCDFSLQWIDQPTGYQVFPEYDMGLQFRTMQLLAKTDVPPGEMRTEPGSTTSRSRSCPQRMTTTSASSSQPRSTVCTWSRLTAESRVGIRLAFPSLRTYPI